MLKYRRRELFEIDAYYYRSPIGLIRIETENQHITYVGFDDSYPGDMPQNKELCEAALKCALQLAEYFGGTRHTFELDILIQGTDFRKRVWTALGNIPYGETRSYKQLASETGCEKAARAVGGAVGHNPVSLIIPCHRVNGSGGSLTGYSGGLWRKEWLLRHEMGDIKHN